MSAEIASTKHARTFALLLREMPIEKLQVSVARGSVKSCSASELINELRSNYTQYSKDNFGKAIYFALSRCSVLDIVGVLKMVLTNTLPYLGSDSDCTVLSTIMQFCTGEDLLQALTEISVAIGKKQMTVEQIDSHSLASVLLMAIRFGTWCSAEIFVYYFLNVPIGYDASVAFSSALDYPARKSVIAMFDSMKVADTVIWPQLAANNFSLFEIMIAIALLPTYDDRLIEAVKTYRSTIVYTASANNMEYSNKHATMQKTVDSMTKLEDKEIEDRLDSLKKEGDFSFVPRYRENQDQSLAPSSTTNESIKKSLKELDERTQKMRQPVLMKRDNDDD